MRPTSTLVPPICAVEVLFVVSIDTAVTVPVCVLPSVAVYDTARPTSAPAERERCNASSAVFCVAISCSDWVWVSVAVCAIMSLVLIGLLGSWYFISATSSLRNVSPPIWSPRSTVVVAVLVATEPAAGVPVPPTGVVIGRSPSHAHVHARGRGPVGGGGRAASARVGRAHPRAWARVAAAGLARAAAVARLLLGRLLLRGLLLRLGGPRPAGVPVDVEPRAADPGRLQVAAQVGQRREQRLPARGMRAAQVEGDDALVEGHLHL